MGVSTPTETVSHSLPSSPIHFDFSLDDIATSSSPRDDESEREKLPPSAIIKKSQLFGIRKELEFKSLPPFRKRVVFLPPVQIVTQRRLLEHRGGEKEVRFFTNVICHEYQSY